MAALTLIARPLFLLFFTSVLLLDCAKAQSGWVKKKGESYTQLSFAGYQSDQYYSLEGEKITTSLFSQHNVYLYSEYGITDNLTVLINFPLLRGHGFESTETVWGIGDTRLDVKYGFLQEILPISFTAGIELPTARPNRMAANTDGFGSINLPTGDGEWNFWTTVAISGSLHPLPAYINISGSYNNRTSFEGQKFKDQWSANTQFGYQFFQKLWLQFTLGLQQSIGEPEGLVSFVRGEGTSFTHYGISLSYELSNNWGIGIQYYNNADLLIQRTNVYSSPTVGISVFFQK